MFALHSEGSPRPARGAMGRLLFLGWRRISGQEPLGRFKSGLSRSTFYPQASAFPRHSWEWRFRVEFEYNALAFKPA